MKKSILLLGLIWSNIFVINASQCQEVNWDIVKTAMFDFASINLFGKAAYSIVLIPKNCYYSVPIKDQIIDLGAYTGLAVFLRKKFKEESNRLSESDRTVANGLLGVFLGLQLTYYGYRTVRDCFY